MLRSIIILLVATSCFTLHSHSSIDHLLTPPIGHLSTSVDNLYFQDYFTNMKTQLDYVNRVLGQTNDADQQFLSNKVAEIEAGFSKLQ